MDVKPEFFLDEIFEIEAEGMLSDILHSTFLISLLMDFDAEKKTTATNYIISVLKEYHTAGFLNVAIQHEGETLYGFALLFSHPQHSAKYLHKIFVYEQYRNSGLGTNLLKSLTESGDCINLICSDDKLKFYKRNGFRYVQPFEIPDNDNFRLSKGLYAGLSIMTSSADALEAPIFFLNDNDLKVIAGFK
jgi:GNAT superfamily N-acetyltransferase